MIRVIFSFMDQTIEVRIVEKTVLFRSSQATQWSDIGGIKLDRPGTIIEFPDLKDNPDRKSVV